MLDAWLQSVAVLLLVVAFFVREPLTRACSRCTRMRGYTGPKRRRVDYVKK